MKYARIAVVLFFVAFLFADLALAGACCDESGGKNDGSCFCCRAHGILEYEPHFLVERLELPLLQFEALLTPFVFSSAIYHPPRS